MTAALARLCSGHAGGSGLQLLDDGPAALAVRLLLVRRAVNSIDAQYYIWQDDVAGRLLLDELVLAAARGVKVRLLLDAFGSVGITKRAARVPGIEVRLFNPPRLRLPRWLNALVDFSRFNRRMHNKSLTIDGVATVIGGRNIGDEYFDAAHPALSADLDVLAIGAVAGAVAGDFERYWTHAAAVPLAYRPGRREPRPRRSEQLLRQSYLAAAEAAATLALCDEAGDFCWSDVQMLSDPPDKISGAAGDGSLLLPQLFSALGDIRRSLLLVSPYLIPTRETARLLGRLAGRGVRVDVLTNSLLSSDVALVHAWYAPWRRRLLAMGVRLWEMQGAAGARVTLGLVPRRLRRRLRGRPDATSFFRASASALHAKTLVVDGRWLFVGSMNFDPRSWRLNTELGFLIDSPGLAGKLQAGIDDGLRHFAWAVEAVDGDLAWRQGGHVLQPEPGTSAVQRLVFRLLGRLPLGHLF